jgi:putative transposase
VSERRELAKEAMRDYQVSERQACRFLGISRTAFRHQPLKPGDEKIANLLMGIAECKPRWGFKKMNDYLKNQGHSWNHKKVHRIYSELGLNLRVKPRKRLPSSNPKPLTEPEKQTFHGH